MAVQSVVSFVQAPERVNEILNSSSCTCCGPKAPVTCIRLYRTKMSCFVNECNSTGSFGVIVCRSTKGRVYPRMYAVSCRKHNVIGDQLITKRSRISAYVDYTPEGERYPVLAYSVRVEDTPSVETSRSNIIFPCFAKRCGKDGHAGGHVRAREDGRILILPSCTDHNKPRSDDRHNVKSIYQDGKNAMWLKNSELRQ